MEEKLLDEDNWKHEAEAVIYDVRDHVANIELSKLLKTTNQHIYINLTTIEKEDFCVQLSAEGFKIVGHQYDVDDIDSEEYFETPYSLLNKISSLFHNSFGNALVNKLNALNNQK